MTIRTLFDRAARDYDRARAQLVPRFDQFYRTVVEILPYERGAALRVLDLGAGTGLLSALVAEEFPWAHFTLVDVSRQMLDKARRRFAAEPARFDLRVMDYAQDSPRGEYDVVVSALSIHHLGGLQKQVLFRSIYEILSDGGIFANADTVRGATPETERIYREAWTRHVRESDVSATDLDAALARMEKDKTSTLESQLRWLRNARFREVECWYKNYNFAVYSGRKLPVGHRVQKGDEKGCGLEPGQAPGPSARTEGEV